MKYSDYEKAFSSARLNKYLKACGEDTAVALKLYRQNVKLCQKFYGVLNIFEVVLRNAIDMHYKAHFSDPDWIKDQLLPGGMLETHPQKAVVEKTIQELIKKGRYTNDRLVSSVTFGFWTYLFTKKPFAAGGKTLLQIFPAKAHGLGQRAVYNELQAIKDFRNRIAHHEAICFDDSGAKNTQPAKDSYSLVLKYVQFFGYPESHLYYGLDVLPDKILRKIDML